MKKILAFVCAAVLTVGTAVTAFAQPSVTVTGVVTGVASATDKDNNAAEIIIKNEEGETLNQYTEEQKALINGIKDLDTLKKVLGDKYVSGMTVVDIKDVSTRGNVAFPLTITFKVTNVTANSKVAVLHFNTTTNQWEVINATAGDGTITATFDSLSPVAFVVDKNTAATVGSNGSTATGSASAGSSSTTSPKTGETNVMAMVSMVAVLAVAGMVVVTKRKRA